ncbi:MAG: kinase [Geobacter sp.]|nr:MAG: kinase [Geobacter sp.]
MEQRVISELQRTSAYPEPTSSIQLLQTHISLLFVTDTFVYKVKKPVDFGFLDFTTLDRRRFYCDEEVRLNRRLCPETYLGVVEVRETDKGAAFYGEGRIIDYAVKMKRLPAERMLDRLLRENKVDAEDMRRIALIIAEFHQNAERGKEIDHFGSIEAIRQNWEENFHQAVEFVTISLAKQDLMVIREWVDSFLSDHADLFTDRVAGGFIRDCDGDIHPENICLTDHVCIFDCIEFNNRFRYGDTAADIAFLLMELDYNDRSLLADIFLNAYIDTTGDRGARRVLDFYKVYRAFVRGKVESFKLSDPQIPAKKKEEARKKAVRYFRLARGYVLRQKLPPTLFITCGLMGSGKSALARELAFELGMARVSSDEIRKEIAGIPPDEHRGDNYGEGIYVRSFNEATYGALLARSEKHLLEERCIIVDATFRSRSDRLEFRGLTSRHTIPFIIIRTDCPERVIKQRLEERIKNTEEISDGRWELFHRQRDEFEPPDESEGRVVVADCSRPVMDAVDEVLKGMGLL